MGTAWMLLKYRFLGPISSLLGNEVKSWREEPESAFLVGATGDCSPTEIWDLTLGFVERWSTDGSLQPLAFLFGVPWGRVYKWRALIPLLPFLWRGWGSTRHEDGAFSPHRKGLERKKFKGLILRMGLRTVCLHSPLPSPPAKLVVFNIQEPSKEKE